MHSFVLQDWLTVRGDPSLTVAQTDGVLDLTGYEDVFAWIDVTLASASVPVVLALETSPLQEDRLYRTFDDTFSVLSLTSNAVSTVLPLRSSTVERPLARYVRWKLSAPGAAGVWRATFRIHVVASLAVPEATALVSARATRNERLLGPWSTRLLDVVGVPSPCSNPGEKRSIFMFGPDGARVAVPKEWGVQDPGPRGCCCPPAPPLKLEDGPK